jgi:hypothetical protein
MATDTYSFTTTTAPDTTPPYTTNHSPAPGETGVAVNTLITVEIRDAGVGVDQTTIGMTVNGATVSPAVSGTPDAYTLTYDPPVDFGYEETVDVTVDASDQNGNAMATDTYSFTTTTAPDTTPPYTTNHSPAPGETGVAVNTMITVEIRDTGVGVDQTTIVMTVNGSAVTPAISGTPDAYTLTYDPPVDFGYEETVDVTVDASDQEGNAMATDTYSFTTTTAPVNQPPTAIIVQPADGATFTMSQTIYLAGDGTDPEDGILPDSAFTWEAAFAGGPFQPLETGVRYLSGLAPAPGNFVIRLTVEDSGGLTDSDEIQITVIP